MLIFTAFIIIFYKIFYQNYLLQRKIELNDVIFPFMILFFIEIFPIRSSGSFFTTNNATYLFLLLGFMISLIDKKLITDKNKDNLKMKKIIISSAVRTAIGSFGKTLKNISAVELGSAVIYEAMKKSKIRPSEVDEVIMGQVLTAGCGQNPARQSAIKSGVPVEKPSYLVNQVCGSGLRSIVSAYHSILTDNSKIVVAGGQESMSSSRHCVHLRDGKKIGDVELVDSMIKDGLWDAFNGYHMGVTAENVAEKFQVTRDEQDRFAIKSQEKALQSQKDNKFKEEIIDFKIKIKKLMK